MQWAPEALNQRHYSSFDRKSVHQYNCEQIIRQNASSFFYASTDLLFCGDGIIGLGYFGLLLKLLQ